MKKTLLTGTALATAAMLGASPASAEIKLSAFLDFGAGFGGTDQVADPSRNGHAFATNSEVAFKGSGKSDAGLEYGLAIELTTDGGDANIDESSMFVSGAFGKVTLGANDAAMDAEIDGSVYGVPGGPGDFDTGISGTFKSSGLTKQENDLDDGGDAQMIRYDTPRFGGIAASVSYTPDAGDQEQMWGGNVNTSHKFEGIGIKLSGSAVHAALNQTNRNLGKDVTQIGYTIGLALDWEGFKFETGYLREHFGTYPATFTSATANSVGTDDSAFVIGAGYGQGPWSIAVQFNTTDEDVSNDQWEAWSVEGSYNIAKGLTVSAAVLIAEETDVSVGPAFDYEEFTANVQMSF